jgi:hypothetical protein
MIVRNNHAFYIGELYLIVSEMFFQSPDTHSGIYQKSEGFGKQVAAITAATTTE